MSIQSSCISATLLTIAACQGAIIDFSFTSSLLYAQPGQTISFSGMLTNTGVTEVFLNGDSFTFPLPVNDIFLFVAPPSLLPSQSFNGPILEVIVPGAAAQGLYAGVFNILGGDSPTAFNTLASAPFAVQVVPEPSAWTGVAGALAGGMFVRFRKRRDRMLR
jgi:hypothetical protein